MPVTPLPCSPGQAHYVIQRMLADRRMAPADITRCLASLADEIRAAEERLEFLRSAHGTNERVPAVRRTGPTRVARRGKKSKSATRASQQLQGRYLGLIKQVPAAKRPQYQEIARSEGWEAAIGKMRKALGK